MRVGRNEVEEHAPLPLPVQPGVDAVRQVFEPFAHLLATNRLLQMPQQGLTARQLDERLLLLDDGVVFLHDAA